MSSSLSEAAVVGACMLDESAYWQVADLLQPRDFAHRGYGALYAEIQRRANENAWVDMIVLADERPDLHEVIYGEPSKQGWRRSSVRSYAETVQRAAIARRVRLAGQQIAHLEDEDMLGAAQRLLGQCAALSAGGMRHIRDFSRMSLDLVEARMQATSELTGVPTGIAKLDDLTGGLQAPDLIILAAEPGVGKTALALQIARATAKRELKEKTGKHVGIFSLEMSGTQLNDRMVAAEGRFDGKLLRTPKRMGESDWARWSEGTAIVQGLPIFVDDNAGVTIEVMCARIRQCHAVTPFSLVVIDYFQLIAPPKADREDIALAMMSRALKNLAKELNVPVLALSQLNKEFKDRPTLRNLRGSMAIGADADVVLFIIRPDETVRDYVELIIGKQRNGEMADLALEFNGKHQTFQMANVRPPSVKSRAVTADMLWDGVGDGDAF